MSYESCVSSPEMAAWHCFAVTHELVTVALHVVLAGRRGSIDGVVAHRVLRAHAIGLLVVGDQVEVP